MTRFSLKQSTNIWDKFHYSKNITMKQITTAQYFWVKMQEEMKIKQSYEI